MPCLEDVFVGEFRRSTSNVGSKNIYAVPLPKEVADWKIDKLRAYGVSGIKESVGGLYSGLNKTYVYKPSSNTLLKKRKINLVTRDFVREADGSYVLEDIEVPTGSMVVVSGKNLDLPYGYKAPSGDFGYVDFKVSKDGTRQFLYIIPKVCLFKLGQTALALSVKNMKNYQGMGYKSWDYGTIFLHVIPYNPAKSYIGTKILKTGVGLNYSKEIKSIVYFWMINGVIPDISLCNISDGRNLALKETVRGYEDYYPIDNLSIGEHELFSSGEGMEDEDEEVEEYEDN